MQTIIKNLIDRFNGKNVKLKERGKLKVVLAGGVFDCIHMGHIHFLEFAKKQGDILVVMIARNENSKKKIMHTVKERVELIRRLSIADLVLPGKKDIKETIEALKPDVIVYGYDQKPFDFIKGIKVIKAPPYDEKRLKTSIILGKKGNKEH